MTLWLNDIPVCTASADRSGACPISSYRFFFSFYWFSRDHGCHRA